MATSIARLAVDFVARTATFSKGTKKAQSDLHRFSASVKSSSASLLRWGGALLGVATGGGLGILIKQQSEAIDVMSKFSKQTGIATEELSAFTMAADLSGVDSESLNKGVTKLAIALGKVRQGIKGADEPFLRIGLNAQKLADAPLGHAMGVIADRMNQIKSPAVKAAAAVAIFGKSGATLLPFLAEGSKGFAAAAKEAKAFGLSFTGIDGTKVEAMNDAWTRTMNLLKGIGRQIAIAISPAVEAALKQFTDWASSNTYSSQAEQVNKKRIGMMVDGAVVMVENAFRIMAERREHGGTVDRTSAVLAAAREVANPIAFAIMIIIVVFIPLFALEGLEGKLFKPMAFNISFAMAGSLVLTLTLIPVLAALILKPKEERDTWLVRIIKARYLPLLFWSLENKKKIVSGAIGFLLFSLALFPFLGKEFMPQLQEGSIMWRVTSIPSTSLDHSIKISKEIENALSQFPEVSNT